MLCICRFPEVAVLRFVWWLEVKGSLETKHLSPNTNYAAYLVYNFSEDIDSGLTDRPVELAVYAGCVNESHKSVILQPPGEGVRQREDGWTEVEMGEFFNEYAEDGSVNLRLWETNGFIKFGLIVEGVEFRPK